MRHLINKELIKKLNEMATSGVIIDNYSYAKNVIKEISPYVLKQYAELYNETISFNKLLDNFIFDKQLRNILLSVIETIEISFRSKISLFYKVCYDEYAYRNSSLFENVSMHKELIFKLDKDIERNLQGKYDKKAQKIYEKYGNNVPIDIALYYFSFGMLSKFFANMNDNDKQKFRKFCHYPPSFIKSSLYCITYLRNLCAHAQVLYFRLFPFVPKFPSSLQIKPEREYKLWHYIIALYLLFPEKEKWNEDFYDRLIHIIQKYNITLSHIGFPADYAAFFQKEEFIEYLNY